MIKKMQNVNKNNINKPIITEQQVFCGIKTTMDTYHLLRFL